jgi:ligand-binding sensor domain-containing protein
MSMIYPGRQSPFHTLRWLIRSWFCLLFLSPFLLQAQSPSLRLEHLTVADGLAENSGMAMLQDHLGFIWIATQNGLHKYDGHEFSLYQHDPADTTTISSNNVVALFEDKAGNIWAVAPEAGDGNLFNVFNRETEQFRHIRFPHPVVRKNWQKNNIITTRAQNPHAVLWWSSLGGGVLVVDLLNRDTRILTKNDGLLTDSVTHVKSIGDSLIWFGWHGKGVSAHNHSHQ